MKYEYLVNIYDGETIEDHYFIYVKGKTQKDIDRKLENHHQTIIDRGHDIDDIDIKRISRVDETC